MASSVTAPSDKPYFGTPTPLPRALLCNSTPDAFCGRVWTANTMAEYELCLQQRQAHEAICAPMMEKRSGILEALKRPTLPFPRVSLN